MKLLATLFLIITSASTGAFADMPDEIHAVLQDKLLHRATVGIEVVRLGSAGDRCHPIFRFNEDTSLIPASNLKLATTSAALDALGPDFKFHTLLVRVNDDLVVIGDGDPTFGD